MMAPIVLMCLLCRKEVNSLKRWLVYTANFNYYFTNIITKFREIIGIENC